MVVLRVAIRIRRELNEPLIELVNRSASVGLPQLRLVGVDGHGLMYEPLILAHVHAPMHLPLSPATSFSASQRFWPLRMPRPSRCLPIAAPRPSSSTPSCEFATRGSH